MKVKLASGSHMVVSQERMADVADYIGRLIQQGQDERDACAGTWKQSKDDYENKAHPYVSKIIDGWDDLPFPFAYPRAEALSDYTVTGISTQSPMVTCLLYGEQGGSEEGVSVQEARERTMETALRRANIEERLKTIAPACWWANAGILRVAAGDEESPIRLDAISPEDFVIVGSGAYTVETSVLVGHRFQRSRADIKRRILAGEYADIDANALSSAGGDGASPDTDMVDLWQVYAYLDLKEWDETQGSPEITKNERRFSVVFETDTNSILYIEEYDYRKPCYLVFGYKPAPERGFWHPRPLGADMQGPHRAYQCLSNTATAGVMMSAFPPFAAQKGSFARDQRYGPGQFIDMESGDLQMPAIRFDLAAVQAELARIERVGDGVARINAAGIGQESSQSKTATQSAAETAGMRAGIGGFIETFAGPLADMCEHIEEILARTFPVWKPLYGAQMPVSDPVEFQTPAKWDVPGKIPNLNPQAVLANAQLLMQLVERILGMVSAIGDPALIEMGISLLRSAMNAMDWPDPEAILKPLEAMIEQQAQPAAPAMGGELDGATGMGPLLEALGGAGGEMLAGMPQPFA